MRDVDVEISWGGWHVSLTSGTRPGQSEVVITNLPPASPRATFLLKSIKAWKPGARPRFTLYANARRIWTEIGGCGGV